MNFMKLKNAQLDELGRLAGIDVTDMGRFDKINALRDEVSEEQYEQAASFDPEGVADDVVEESPRGDESAAEEVAAEESDGKEEEFVLIKMERRNPRYETHGKTFTKEHPYAAVPESVAKSIMDTEKGFRPALPSEVKEYYNR